MSARVVLADPDAAGLDAMLAGLITAAAADPTKGRMLDSMRGTVTITVPDVEVEVGLRFADGVCTVLPSAIPGAMLHLTMDSEQLLGLSAVPLLFGLPSLLTSAGRDVTLSILTRKVKIGGMQHIVLLRQLTTLLSVA